MSFLEILQRLMDEQGWREKKAQSMSSGLGSLPYNFQEQMERRVPMLQHYYNKADTKDAQREALIKNLENHLGPKPNWFEERYQQQHWQNQRASDLSSIYKKGM
jgi:hypothetical protein